MIIAFSARGPDPDYELDESFGRAYWLLILNDQSGSWTAIENRENRLAQENAGIATARVVIGYGVKTVVTGKIGPRAFRELRRSGIDIYMAGSGRVAALLESWRKSDLPELTAANSQGSPFCLMASPMREGNAMSRGGNRQGIVADKTRKGWLR